jgi:hypothetical protein
MNHHREFGVLEFKNQKEIDSPAVMQAKKAVESLKPFIK